MRDQLRSAMTRSANALGRLGKVMLPGSLAQLMPCKRGDHLRVTIGGMGGASIRFVRVLRLNPLIDIFIPEARL